MASAFLDRVSNKALGELLVDKGALSEVQLAEALEVSKQQHIRLGEALISLGYLSRDALGYAIGEQYGMRPMELQPSMVDLDLVSRFDYELLSAHTMLPLIELGNELVVVVGDPNEQQGLEALAHILPGRQITPQLGASAQIRRCLEAIHAHQIHGAGDSVSHSSPVSEGAELEPRQLTEFAKPPSPQADDFLEWLISLAAQNPDRDVLVREVNDDLQVSLTPPVKSTAEAGNEVGLMEVARWPDGSAARVCHAVASRAIPIEHTRGQASRWVYAGIADSGTYDFLLLTPIVQGSPVTRIRAICHLHNDQFDHTPPVPLQPRLNAGQYTVVLYDESCNLEHTLAHFVAEQAAEHQFLLVQQATRCAIAGAPAYPAPFTNIVAAVQASAATCVIFDHPVDYLEATRLLTSTYPPPAVLVCAPMPSHASGAGSLSPDVEELLTRQGAQSVRLMDDNPDMTSDSPGKGNN